MRAGFLISDFLGFKTYTDNLRRALQAQPEIDPTWMLVSDSVKDVWRHVPQFTFSTALRANSILRRQRQPLDVLLMCTQTLGLFAQSSMRRIPTVVSLDATPMNFNEIVAGYGRKPPSSLGERVKTRMNKSVFDAAQTVIAWSQWTARSVIRDYGVAENKVEQIYPGINLDQWLPRPDTRPGERLRLLFVGGHFERKGGELILAALRSGALPDVDFDVVSNDLSVESSPGVRVHRGLSANSEALRQLFQTADVFILPTAGDTNPWVILEAMASGLPVISTRMAAIPEQVVDGETGLLIAPGDVVALTSALVALRNDPSRRIAMGRAGRARAETHFNGVENYRRTFAIMQRAALSGSRR